MSFRESSVARSNPELFFSSTLPLTLSDTKRAKALQDKGLIAGLSVRFSGQTFKIHSVDTKYGWVYLEHPALAEPMRVGAPEVSRL